MYTVLYEVQEEHVALGKKVKGEYITYEEIASCKYTSKVCINILHNLER